MTEFCRKEGLTRKQVNGRTVIKGNLTIQGDKLPVGFTPKLEGFLNIVNVKHIPQCFSPDCYGTWINPSLRTPKGFEDFNMEAISPCWD